MTFDTNVTECNLNCVMCEGFSVYRPEDELKAQKKKGNKRIMPFELLQVSPVCLRVFFGFVLVLLRDYRVCQCVCLPCVCMMVCAHRLP